ncbi:MAG TPA: tail fiber domain-containing protein [Kofleriaceae bacterium]|jgi:hypothetical protein|nr:tail fiber domain-containing protein [Kofleriaceae bacterium]
MAWYKPWTWGDESESSKQKRTDLNDQGAAASDFANRSEANFGQLGSALYDQAGQLKRLQSGQDSLSREQLRQGLEQNVAAQRSLAASAAPRDAAMMARTAAMNAGRLGAGMSGAAAQAGIQERRGATEALNNLLMQQRQQEMMAALQGRQNALTAYTGVVPEKNALEKMAPIINAGVGLGAAALSDRRLKNGVKDGDDEARSITEGLKSYRFKYKDQKHGKGSQYGVMAQDLEKAGLKHAVVDTPIGKAVDGAKLSTANTALIGALGRRLAKLEGSRK